MNLQRLINFKTYLYSFSYLVAKFNIKYFLSAIINFLTCFHFKEIRYYCWNDNYVNDFYILVMELILYIAHTLYFYWINDILNIPKSIYMNCHANKDFGYKETLYYD